VSNPLTARFCNGCGANLLGAHSGSKLCVGLEQGPRTVVADATKGKGKGKGGGHGVAASPAGMFLHVEKCGVSSCKNTAVNKCACGKKICLQHTSVDKDDQERQMQHCPTCSKAEKANEAQRKANFELQRGCGCGVLVLVLVILGIVLLTRAGRNCDVRCEGDELVWCGEKLFSDDNRVNCKTTFHSNGKDGRCDAGICKYNYGKTCKPREKRGGPFLDCDEPARSTPSYDYTPRRRRSRV